MSSFIPGPDLRAALDRHIDQLSSSPIATIRSMDDRIALQPGTKTALAKVHGPLPEEGDAKPIYGAIGPERSRRARGCAAWATLGACGQSGRQAIVERRLDIAHHIAGLVRECSDLELLNICATNGRCRQPCE